MRILSVFIIGFIICTLVVGINKQGNASKNLDLCLNTEKKEKGKFKEYSDEHEGKGLRQVGN